eukprot:SAG11_NODE_37076_length_258_cov_1.245283_2_plen_20_part_01
MIRPPGFTNRNIIIHLHRVY